MKIVHTSDWHLGARLREEDRSMEHAAFLDWLAGLMAGERPDALVVSGDIFDLKSPSPQAQSLYYGFLARVVAGRLCRRVIVVAGNHDNSRLLAAPSRLLVELGVSVVSVAADDVSGEVVVVPDASGSPGLAVAAIPFMFEAELSNFGLEAVSAGASREERTAAGWRCHVTAAIEAARAAAPGVPVVATGHAAVLGAAASDADSERCRCVGGVEACDPSPFAAADYVALGHLHRPQAVPGCEGRVFYSGSPLRMSFDEGGCAKVVNVVTFGAPGEPPRVEHRAVPETVPLVTLRGAPAEVMASLSRLVAGDRHARRFVRVQLDGFAGEAAPWWAQIRAVAADTATLVLEENDLRAVPGAAVGLRAFAGRGIRQLSAREVAEQKLRTSASRYGDEEIAAFLAMFDEVAGGLT